MTNITDAVDMHAMNFEPATPDYRFVYKHCDNCENGGPSMDVMLPPSINSQSTVPVAILYHGGAFTVGASSDLAHHQVQWYLRHGFAVVSPEYRLVPHVCMKEIRQDLLDSYLYIQHQLNDKLSSLSDGKAPRLDTARCVSAGGSAGGSSCLFLAMEIRDYNAKQEAAQKVNELRGIVPAYPMCNPDDGYENTPRSKLEQLAKQKCPEDWLLIEDVFKGPAICDFKTNSMPLEGRDPRTLFVMRAMEYICLNSYLAGRDPPYNSECYITDNVSSDLPPVYVLVAPVDSLIPAKQSYDLYKALVEKGVDVEIGEGKGAEHGFTEMSPKYWPEGAQWWTETILPSLKWARDKALA